MSAACAFVVVDIGLYTITRMLRNAMTDREVDRRLSQVRFVSGSRFPHDAGEGLRMGYAPVKDWMFRCKQADVSSFAAAADSARDS